MSQTIDELDLGNIDELDLDSIHDIDLISAKWAYKTEDLTDEEISLIIKMIENEHKCKIDDLSEFDLFDNDVWCMYDIAIKYWKYKDDILIDINSFPGDAEVGAIFYNGELILVNNNGQLGGTSSTPDKIYYMMESLEHLRPDGDLECEDKHHECVEIHLKYCDFVERECKCEFCRH